VNGSWLFQFIMDLNKSSNTATSHHLNGNREIDFIAGTMRMTDVGFHLPHIRQLSDHNPICVTIDGTTEEVTALVPDRTVARDLCRATLSEEEPSPSAHL
jgi:hypothetical protein